MANVAKYIRADIGNMTRHYERAVGADGEYLKFNNIDIDTERTQQNYNLGPQRDDGQLKFINRRLSEVKCQNRADVNVMCSWVITAPKSLPKSDEKQFFEESYKFLNDRYFGGSDKNVISAHVHMDETTPHMHYAFIPVVEAEKNDKKIEKVSAKLLLNRADLIDFHKDYNRRMTEVFDRDIGVLNEATRDGNKTVTELKRATELEEQAQHAAETAEFKQELESVKSELRKRSKHKVNVNKSIPMPVKKFGGEFYEKTAMKPIIKGYEAYKEHQDTIHDIGNRERKLAKAEAKLEKDINHHAEIYDKYARIVDECNTLHTQLEHAEQTITELRDGTEITKLQNRLQEKDDIINSQRNIIAELKEKIEELSNKLRAAFESIKAMAQGVSMLKWHDGDYKANLTPKQDKLVEAIPNYAAKWAKHDGFPEVAEDIKENFGITDGLQNEIDALDAPVKQKARKHEHKL